tara:strand:- start:181 stop:396 length:216 start_codon:yes stop_codon:yes gene_type:complete
MTDKQLSPEAQAVWDAFNDVTERVGVFEDYGDALADALRAVVEHCVPDDSEGHWVYIPQVLAIANELEGKK